MQQKELENFQKTVIYDENNDIFMQPLCDLFEINYQNQLRFIKSDHILSQEWIKKSAPKMYNDGQKRHCLTKTGFLRWIIILNPNIIKIELQEQFKSYQKLITDYLFSSSITPLMKETHALNARIMEIHREINALLLEEKKAKREIKRLEDIKHGQLGFQLIYTEEGKPELLQPFNQKAISETTDK